MMLTSEQMVEQLLSLPFEGRAQMVERLIESLNHTDPEIEAAWIEEVKRRSQEVADGVVETIAADEVFADARRRLDP